jgi:hypothetical protein
MDRGGAAGFALIDALEFYTTPADRIKIVAPVATESDMKNTLRVAAAGLCVALTFAAHERAESQPAVTPGGSQAAAVLLSDTTVTPSDPEFIPSPNNLYRVEHMVWAVSLFTLLHELGHMIVSEYKVPVVGKEEDGVDRFATLMMTPPAKPPGSPPDTFDPATDPESPLVMWAAWWWHELWRRQRAAGEVIDYANRHGLNISRSVEVMCLVYGADPERFERPFRTFLLERTRPSCIDDYYENRDNWTQVLGQAERGNGWKYRGRVAYNPASAELERVRTWLMERRVLEEFAEKWVDALPVPSHAIPKGEYPALESFEPYRVSISVVADYCPRADGRPRVNAFWDSASRRIVLCYAFVEQFERFSRETIARTEIGQSEKMPE